MKKFALIVLIALSALVSKTVVQAQTIDVQELQANIDIFTGVLEDALELNQNSGLFGMRLGGVDATYLYQQGVLIEIRTPLANQRNRLSLASLNSAMQTIQTGVNPFERMVRRAAPTPATTAETESAEADSFYNAMMEQIAKIDYSLIVSNAIQQASDAARSLRALGNVNDSDFENLRNELEAMRARLQENVDQLDQLEEELRSAGSSQQPDNSLSESDVNARLAELMARLEPLRDQAIAKAEELKARTELAEQQYVQRWHEDVEEFEENLYATLCNYGTTLRVLPENESISVILKGLGEDEANSNRRPDKVHVLSKANVQQCQNGNIDVAELRSRSAQYSY